MSMPTHALGDSHDGTQIKVTSKKWLKNSMGEIETWISSKDRAQKTEPGGANDVSKGHRMTMWCMKDKLDQLEAYKQDGTHDMFHFHCAVLSWSGGPQNTTIDFFQLDWKFFDL